MIASDTVNNEYKNLIQVLVMTKTQPIQLSKIFKIFLSPTDGRY